MKCFLTNSCSVVPAFTHHFHSAEHVTKVVAALQILGDVRKSAEVVGVLGRARDVPDLMLRNYGLKEGEGVTDGKAATADVDVNL